jgi:hypothetical protein
MSKSAKNYSIGGFVFNWIWGLFNAVSWTLIGLALIALSVLVLAFVQIPVIRIGIVLCTVGWLVVSSIFLLMNGRTVARKAVKKTGGNFEKKQQAWDTAGIVALLLFLILGCLAWFVYNPATVKTANDAYRFVVLDQSGGYASNANFVSTVPVVPARAFTTDGYDIDVEYQLVFDKNNSGAKASALANEKILRAELVRLIQGSKKEYWLETNKDKRIKDMLVFFKSLLPANTITNIFEIQMYVSIKG